MRLMLTLVVLAAAARAADEPAPRPQYYSDLGPDFVDVSNYPAQQKKNYAVYAAVCSRCHTLARSINAPTASRGFWEMYVLGMRAQARIKGKPITAAERKAVLDFLEYDSYVRKVENGAAFRKTTKQLKRKYDKFLADELRMMQETKQPTLNPSAP